MAQPQPLTQPVAVAPAGADDDGLTYAEQVELRDLQRQVARTDPRAYEIVRPTLQNAQNYDREARRIQRERRRKQRLGQGRHLQEIDERGVRGAQKSQPFTPDQELTLIENGRSDLLEPYFSERGRSAGAPLSTSWVDNVAFSAQVISNIKTINIAALRGRRVVDNPDRSVVQTVGDDGRLTAGGEYAVFEYELAVDDPIVEANRSDVVDLAVTARYDGVARTVPSGGRYRLEFDKVQSYLETATDVPVELHQHNLIVQKLADGRNLGLTTAIVTSPYYKYTLRRDPRTDQWLLTRMQFWLMRHHLLGLDDKQRYLYLRCRFSVNGVEQEDGTLRVVQDEDPRSNPLSPQLNLNLLPDKQLIGGALELLPGESLTVQIDVTDQLVERRKLSSGAIERTRWQELPELGFQLSDNRLLLRKADKTGGGGVAKVTLDRDQLSQPSQRRFQTSALGLDKTTVTVYLNPSSRRPAGYALRAIVLGPVPQQSLVDALRDSRRRI